MKPLAGQQSLVFAPVIAPKLTVVPADSHTENLRRVRANIGAAIEKFCADRLALQTPRFHMADLDGWVRETVRGPIAPESVGRILRDLRQSKRINYVLRSRRASEYEVVPL